MHDSVDAHRAPDQHARRDAELLLAVGGKLHATQFANQQHEEEHAPDQRHPVGRAQHLRRCIRLAHAAHGRLITPRESASTGIVPQYWPRETTAVAIPGRPQRPHPPISPLTRFVAADYPWLPVYFVARSRIVLWTPRVGATSVTLQELRDVPGEAPVRSMCRTDRLALSSAQSL